MMSQVAEELGVAYRRNGSLVVAFDDNDMNAVSNLYSRGIVNGVTDLQIIDAEKTSCVGTKYFF